MKFERIESDARVWTVNRGADGRLQHSVDPALVASLYPGLSDDEIADAIVIAQGTAEIAEKRAW